eukprot:scaffold8948_cov151-Skeletonema_marinoi.AAC.1
MTSVILTWIVIPLCRLLWLLFSSSSQNSSDDEKKNTGGDGSDPFKVLGLDGGKGNTTIEEATKARRKLALKWHPDRNIGNEEEATKKMQDINHAFTQVEKILCEGGGNVQEDEAGQQQQSESEDERDPRAAKRRAKRHRRKERQEEEKFERDVREEFANFERAHRNAARGSFDTTSPPFAAEFPPPPRGGRGKGGKGKSKSARKNARQRAKQRERQRKQSRVQSAPQCRNLDENNEPLGEKNKEGAGARDIPFHHLPLEKRCEIKFQSKELLKSTVFAALRTRAYYVLRVLAMTQDLCDHFPLPAEEGGDVKEVFVTPLMIASYLGDYKAADILIQCAGKKWKDDVLAKSSQGDDCLTLAKEARDIAQLLYDEAREYEVEAATKKELKRREKIVGEYAENLEMAVRLVERLNSMKPIALELEEKAREERTRMLGFMSMGVMAVGIAWKLYSS